MAWLTTPTSTTLNGSPLNTSLQELLMCPDIVPGSDTSYQINRQIYEYVPIAKKMIDAPITMAQSQQREVTVAAGPEERVREAFLEARKAMKADEKCAQHARLARMQGISVMAVVQKDVDPALPLDFRAFGTSEFSINVLDPLNTAGSLGVLNQDPNALSFQDVPQVRVAGKTYHPSRTLVLMNGAPLYLSYTSSAFGFYGRSVYQPVLYPLKSFVQTMRTDDLVTRKAGVIVAMIKQVGSMVDRVQAAVTGGKRNLAREAQTDDVLSIGNEDKIESMNLQNLEGPYALARKNIIENIAAGADMPAIILNSETYAEGFGEGTEDAKKVASFVDNFRLWMDPSYEFTDTLAMYRAWTPDFYAEIQKTFPEEYRGVDYDAAFYAWRNSFRAAWPSLITEPDSEKIKVDEVRFRSAVALAEIMLPKLDPDNATRLLLWLADTANEQKLLFPVTLELDPDAIETFVQKQAENAKALQDAGREAAENQTEEPKPPRPFADSNVSPIPLGRR